MYPGSYLEEAERGRMDHTAHTQHGEHDQLQATSTGTNAAHVTEASSVDRMAGYKAARVKAKELVRRDIARLHATDNRRVPAWYGRGRSRAPRRQRKRRGVAKSGESGWGANAGFLRAFGRQRFLAAQATLEAVTGKGHLPGGVVRHNADHNARLNSRATNKRVGSNGHNMPLGGPLGGPLRGMEAPVSLLQYEAEGDAPHGESDPLSAGNDLDSVYHTMHDTSDSRKYDVTVPADDMGDESDNNSIGGSGQPLRFAEVGGGLTHSKFFSSQPKGNKITPRKGKRPNVKGKFGYTDKDRFDSQAEKGDEFAYVSFATPQVSLMP